MLDHFLCVISSKTLRETCVILYGAILNVSPTLLSYLFYIQMYELLKMSVNINYELKVKSLNADHLLVR